MKNKSCPYCGKTKIRVWKGNSERYMTRDDIISYAYCATCYAQGPEKDKTRGIRSMEHARRGVEQQLQPGSLKEDK